MRQHRVSIYGIVNDYLSSPLGILKREDKIYALWDANVMLRYAGWDYSYKYVLTYRLDYTMYTENGKVKSVMTCLTGIANVITPLEVTLGLWIITDSDQLNRIIEALDKYIEEFDNCRSLS